MSSEASFAEIGSRVAAFIRQRYPQHASKQIQRAFDLNARTAERVLSGQISNRTLEKMVRAWGPPFAQYALEPLTGSIAGPICLPQSLWITETGVQPVNQGHAEYARKSLGLRDSGQDFCLFTVRNFGWIEASVSADGHATLRYSEAGVSTDALEATTEWLKSSGAVHVTRRYETPEGWTEEASGVSDAAQSLSRLIASRQPPRADWTVERIALPELRRPDFIELVKMSREGDDATAGAAHLKLLDTASIFSVDGSNVVSLWCGPRLGIPKHVGRNVLDRPERDRPYAALVRRRVIEAQSEGATLYNLAVDIDGKRRTYQSLAINCGGGRVISCADLSEEARAA